MSVHDALNFRRAVPHFDSSVAISKEQVLELCNLANLAPSSLGLQPWEYLICTTAEAKERLKAASYNQNKVTEASAVVVVLGNLLHHEHAPKIADSNIELGYFGEERRQPWIDGAFGAYANNPQKQRDESFRGSSLWAMAFMLAAADQGWDTAPMGGFEPDKVAQAFGLPETHIPTLIVCIGKRPEGAKLLPRNYRFPAEDLAHWENW